MSRLDRFRKGMTGIYVVSLVAIILWGLSYLWSQRLIIYDVPIEYFVFIRVLAAGLLLLLLNISTGHSMRIHRKDCLKFLALAFCEPFVYFVCETYGIEMTESPTLSALIIATTPILSIFAGIFFFKEKLTWINVLGFLVCFAGIVMVTTSAGELGEHFVWGVVLLVAAVIAEVGHASFTKSLSGNYTPQVIVMYQFLFGSVYLLPLFCAKGLEGFVPAWLTWDVMGPILCLSLLCSGLAFTLWVSSIKRLGVAKSSIFLAMIPVVTAVSGRLMGQEFLSRQQWYGIAVAVIGVVFSQLVFRRRSRRLKG